MPVEPPPQLLSILIEIHPEHALTLSAEGVPTVRYVYTSAKDFHEHCIEWVGQVLGAVALADELYGEP